MEALFQFRDLIYKIDNLFQCCSKGVFFVEDDRLEEYFEGYIDKIRNFNVSDIEEELIKDKGDLKNVSFIFRNPPVWFNKDGYFPESNELEPMRKKLEQVNSGKWVNDVLCGLSAVANWTNNLISEVCAILDDLQLFTELEDNQLQQTSSAKDERQKCQYPDELVKLFHGNTYLIDSLVGLSDDEIVKKIKEWSKEKDKLGKPLIENQKNGLKSAYSKALKEAGFIKISVDRFSRKL